VNELRDLLTRLVDVEPRVNASDMLAAAEHRARELRTRRTRARFVAAAAVAAVIATIVIVVTSTGGRGDKGRISVAPTPTITTPALVPAQQYSADATVLQDPTHGPELCFLVATSNPPQCTGTPIAGWDWKKVDKEESVNGTTWGEFHVVGTYDGKTITRPATTAHTPPPLKLPSYRTPCPTPPGGWTVPDRSKYTIDDYNAFTNAARAEPDAAGLWLDSSTPVDGKTDLFPAQVINVAFTGDLDAHRARLRALWGGPFCVIHHARSLRELGLIQQALNGDVGRELGLQLRWSSIDEVNNDIRFDVLVATPAVQSALDRRYGIGVVHLHGLLIPVP
jgi:hypothetical protein